MLTSSKCNEKKHVMRKAVLDESGCIYQNGVQASYYQESGHPYAVCD